MLVLEGLCAGHGEVNVLFDVSIEIGENESVAILGPNGAGKSTLVSAISGLIPTRRGKILKDGHPIHVLPAHSRAEIGIAVVLEGRHLFGELSVRQNLELAHYIGRKRKAGSTRFQIRDVLELFPFMQQRAGSPVDLLSGGEQQMVAIGRALLLNPDLLILDEPSTGLAPKVVMDIVGVLAALRNRGLSLMLVEQNVSIAAQSSDRAYVISLGRVVRHVAHDEWADIPFL